MRLYPTLATVAGSLVAVLLAAPSGVAEQRATQRDPDGVVTVAHRGARYVAPENTLVAIKAAVAREVDFVEVDVRRTKDGRLVLVHDNDLRRTTDVEKVFPRRKSRPVSAFTLAQLKRLDAGSWKAPRYAGERIPTLKQAVRLLRDSDTGVVVELKAPALYPGIESDLSVTLRQVDGYIGDALRDGRLVVQSFDFEAARRFKELEPRARIALLGTPDVAVLPELSQWADEISSRHKSVDADYVAAVHSLGMTSSVWTVDNPDNINANLDKGVDGVVTDRPALLDRLIQQRSTAS